MSCVALHGRKQGRILGLCQLNTKFKTDSVSWTEIYKLFKLRAHAVFSVIKDEEEAEEDDEDFVHHNS